MFFIFGTPRSGTTLLAQCLYAHGEIVIPDETDFIVPAAFVFDRIHDPGIGKEIIASLITNTERFKPSLGEYLSADEVRDIVFSSEYNLVELLKSIYGEVARKEGKKIAGDKSPNDLGFLGILRKTGALSSDIKIIHLVRDVRDVMVSLKGLGWIKELADYFPWVWTNQNLSLNKLLKDQPSRYMLVRYEDFVSAPEAHLSSICGFLGLEFQSGMLSPSRRHHRYKEIPPHANLYTEISTGMTGRYKTSIDPRTLARYEDQAKEGLRTFGYEVASPTGSGLGRLIRKTFK